MERSSSPSVAATNMQCKLGSKCPNPTHELFVCWDPSCDGWMHKECSTKLLVRFDIPTEERPTADEVTPAGDPVVFCKKGCWKNWSAEKKREAKAAKKAQQAQQQKEATRKRKTWEEDGSLDVLMEWLTTEGNYAEYCGCNGNKGKTKTQHHKELAILLKEKLPECERTEKDVENKIVNLERQFRQASDWVANTGQGVDNPGDFEAAVKRRCPLFQELEPIMGDRPNARPLATNEDSSSDGSSVASGIADTAAMASMMSYKDTPAQKSSSQTSNSISSKSAVSIKSGSAGRRLLSKNSAQGGRSQKKKKTWDADDTLSSLFMDDYDGDNTFKNLRVREVEAKEREASAKMLEATANSEKAKQESSLISIQANATLLRERKKLREEGISQEEIDALLPLQK